MLPVPPALQSRQWSVISAFLVSATGPPRRVILTFSPPVGRHHVLGGSVAIAGAVRRVIVRDNALLRRRWTAKRQLVLNHMNATGIHSGKNT